MSRVEEDKKARYYSMKNSDARPQGLVSWTWQEPMEMHARIGHAFVKKGKVKTSQSDLFEGFPERRRPIQRERNMLWEITIKHLLSIKDWNLLASLSSSADISFPCVDMLVFLPPSSCPHHLKIIQVDPVPSIITCNELLSQVERPMLYTGTRCKVSHN